MVNLKKLKIFISHGFLFLLDKYHLIVPILFENSGISLGMKKFIENSVDSVKFLAYNDIEAESLLRNLRSVMHNTKGGMPT